MFVGIQGSGKTTTAAKLARFYKNKGFKPGLICADTYRPAAYDQLKQLSEQIQVPFYGETEEKNAIKIAKRGIEYLTKLGCNLIIIDTAGRHKNEASLMEEMKELSKEINPDHIILVIDGTIGQAAYNQAKAFSEATKIGSIIITKLDGSAKGGGAISAVKATNSRISFIGLGEKIDEFDIFDPISFVNNLIGLGDIATLARKLEEAKIEEKITKEKLLSGEFTLEELVQQIKEFKKAGPLSKLFKLIPGFSLNLPEEVFELAEKNLEKWDAILKSMTKQEKKDPKIIDKSRMRRIARGSGTDVKDVENLIKTYNELRKNIKKIKRLGIPIKLK